MTVSAATKRAFDGSDSVSKRHKSEKDPSAPVAQISDPASLLNQDIISKIQACHGKSFQEQWSCLGNILKTYKKSELLNAILILRKVHKDNEVYVKAFSHAQFCIKCVQDIENMAMHESVSALQIFEYIYHHAWNSRTEVGYLLAGRIHQMPAKAKEKISQSNLAIQRIKSIGDEKYEQLFPFFSFKEELNIMGMALLLSDEKYLKIKKIDDHVYQIMDDITKNDRHAFLKNMDLLLAEPIGDRSAFLKAFRHQFPQSFNFQKDFEVKLSACQEKACVAVKEERPKTQTQPAVMVWIDFERRLALRAKQVEQAVASKKFEIHSDLVPALTSQDCLAIARRIEEIVNEAWRARRPYVDNTLKRRLHINGIKRYVALISDWRRTAYKINPSLKKVITAILFHYEDRETIDYKIELSLANFKYPISQITREFPFQMVLHGTGVVQPFSIAEFKEKNAKGEWQQNISIIMDRAGTALNGILRNENLKLDTQNFGRQLIKIVAEMHRRGIIHGDLKPRNIIIDLINQIVKVIDLGHASWIMDEEMIPYDYYLGLGSYGAWPYNPPELFTPNSLPRNAEFFKKVESWVVGLIIILFKHRNEEIEWIKRMWDKSKDKNLRFPYPVTEEDLKVFEQFYQQYVEAPKAAIESKPIAERTPTDIFFLAVYHLLVRDPRYRWNLQDIEQFFSYQTQPVKS